jgi:ATP-binding cassette subfamily C protein LapB
MNNQARPVGQDLPHLAAVPGGQSGTQRNPGAARASANGQEQHIPLFDAVSLLTQLLGKPVSARALINEVARQGATVGAGQVITSLKHHGFSAKVSRRALGAIPTLALPAVLLLHSGNACVLRAIGRDGAAEVLVPELGMEAPQRLSIPELAAHFTGWVVFARIEASPFHPAVDSEPDAGPDPSISWFWRTLWSHRRYYLESAVAAVIINILGLSMSLFTMNVYDRVVPNHALESLWVLSIGVTVAIGFEFVARTLRGHFMDVAAQKADLTLSSSIFKHVLGLRGEFRPGSAGNLAAQVQGFEVIREFIGSAAMVAISDLPFAALYLWVMHMLAGDLAWVPLVTIPIVLVVNMLIQIPLNRAVQAATRAGYSKQGVLVEAIDGMDTLKALNAQGFSLGQWERASTATARSTHASRKWSACAVNFSNLVSQLATVATVFLGVQLLAEGKLTQGALVAGVMLTGRVLAPLSQISGLLARFHHAHSAYQALRKLMSQPAERQPGKSYLHRPRFDGRLSLRDVQFAYPGSKSGRSLIDIQALEIGPGEKVAIVGRVGGGKSTLLHVLSGLLQPTMGVVLCDGVDQAQIDPADVRQNIGLVNQHSRLFRGTLRENLLLGAPYADAQAMLRYAELCGVHDWATRHPMGYDMPVAEAGANLSGGQRQMVALARALLVGTPVVLLDEPTSALDVHAEQKLLARLKLELRRRTLVVVTHRPALLSLVERIIVLDDGRVAADGPRDAVLRAMEQGSKASGGSK